MYVALNYIQLDARDAATKEFMRAPDDLNGPPDYEFSCRLLDVGEMLFNLRSTVSFLEICRRLKRDIRSGFFEAFSARMFFDSGFEILATPEIQQKGEDFDFKAVRGVETINVEVTALTASEFSEKTALSALKEKRKQLPKGSPAVIFCIFPDAWWYVRCPFACASRRLVRFPRMVPCAFF